MTILTSIFLVVAIIVLAAFIAYNMQRGTKALSEFKADFDNNEEAQELADLARELYNKDLRPTPVKKAPKKKKPEFPVDQPTKKVKAVEQIETIAEVIPEVIVEEPVKEQPTAVNIEPVVEITPVQVEAVLEPAKPKKKRKYYPRKPKTTK
jgi:FtsZ-interacting cell division protein ZipA